MAALRHNFCTQLLLPVLWQVPDFVINTPFAAARQLVEENILLMMAAGESWGTVQIHEVHSFVESTSSPWSSYVVRAVPDTCGYAQISFRLDCIASSPSLQLYVGFLAAADVHCNKLRLRLCCGQLTLLLPF